MALTGNTRLRHKWYSTYASLILACLWAPFLFAKEPFLIDFAHTDSTTKKIKPHNVTVLTLEKHIASHTSLKVKGDFNVSDKVNPNSSVEIGWGLEHDLSQKWSVRVYYYSGNQYGNLSTQAPGSASNLNVNHTNSDIFLVGLFYSF
jgi:opacity protein-like surface antigen